ncbi:UNVERIFIED_CONTAM: putative mitochondrial protein [Sesamum latifolium]|uniref:Mitochondrial protein n=1 Tax=Sesamum latifolium TaxID=2727402 RepID=A0AAW2UKS8_9LAMI
MWTKHHDFRNCVDTSWQYPIHGRGMFKFQQKLYRLKAALKTWNFEVFGNIFQNIEKAEQTAKNCEKQYDDDPSYENIIAMNKAITELTFALLVEECYWKQKAACRWLTERHNGAILTKPEEIKESIVDYFKQVFTAEEEEEVSFHLCIGFQISYQRRIFNAFAVSPHSKKLSLWSSIGAQTARLTPMASHPTSIRAAGILLQKIYWKQLWISFMEPLHLRISQRLRLSSFPKLRIRKLERTLDRSAYELVHCLGVNGSRNNTIFKLDMAKAYDRLNWNFLYRMLSRIGFTVQWIAKIRMLTENCWFNILINGEGVGFFKSTRGLRQGDPLSPTLFVLTAESLSRGLDSLFKQHTRLNFLTRGSLTVSHLAFADDVIIFSKGKRKELKMLMDFLWHYEAISGQRINKDKSSFTVDKRTSNLRIQCIQQVTGFRLKHLPITYLGAPLFKGNKKGVLFDDLVQKIKNRISGWEKALLSHGGRLQLIKSVLSVMPTYLLQTLKPPKFITERIERIFNKFFWGSFGNQKRMIWSSWESVCYPTEEGGLDV